MVKYLLKFETLILVKPELSDFFRRDVLRF